MLRGEVTLSRVWGSLLLLLCADYKWPSHNQRHVLVLARVISVFQLWITYQVLGQGEQSSKHKCKKQEKGKYNENISYYVLQRPIIYVTWILKGELSMILSQYEDSLKINENIFSSLSRDNLTLADQGFMVKHEWSKLLSNRIFE